MEAGGLGNNQVAVEGKRAAGLPGFRKRGEARACERQATRAVRVLRLRGALAIRVLWPRGALAIRVLWPHRDAPHQEQGQRYMLLFHPVGRKP